MKTVLCVIPMTDAQKLRLEAAAEGCEIIYSIPTDVTEDMVQQASIIIGNVPAGFIHASERLELLQLNSAGTDDYFSRRAQCSPMPPEHTARPCRSICSPLCSH